MGKPKNGKKPADSVQSAAPAQGAEPKAEKEYKDNSFKLGLKHTGAAALEVGALVVTEKPVMKIILKSDEPSQAELQQWVDRFAALDPNSRDRIMELAAHQKAVSHGALAKIVGKRGEQLQEKLKIPEGVKMEDAWELMLVLESNSVEFEMKGGMYLSVLCLGISHLKHSCSPNALLGMGKEAGTIELRALKPIAPGDEVTVSYLGEPDLMVPTSERQAYLKKRWQFRCVCERCGAPDMLRAFKCPKVNCKGLVYANSAGDGIEACIECGKDLAPQQTQDFFRAEANCKKHHDELKTELLKAAGSLQMAVEARNGDGLASASEVAISTLSRAVHIYTTNRQVDPSHYAIAGLATAAASVRTMLGDSMAATGREEKAKKMWIPAAGELKEAIDAHYRALPLPRDGYAQDMAGLAALYGRLGKPEEARKCFQEAADVLDLVSWACDPARREELDLLRKGCEAALQSEDRTEKDVQRMYRGEEAKPKK